MSGVTAGAGSLRVPPAPSRQRHRAGVGLKTAGVVLGAVAALGATYQGPRTAGAHVTHARSQQP